MNPLVLGGVLLAAGFVAGFFAGRESLRHESGTTVAASGRHAGVDVGAGGGPMTSGAMSPASVPERSGHTFTGEINAPPHGEAGHALAQKLLAGATCPCGGCDHMVLLECGCDTAREIEGLAAHLLERGKSSTEVFAQLNQHFGLVAPDGARGSVVPAPGDGLEGLADAFSKKPSVGGPAEVPSSARRIVEP